MEKEEGVVGFLSGVLMMGFLMGLLILCTIIPTTRKEGIHSGYQQGVRDGLSGNVKTEIQIDTIYKAVE